MRYPPPDSYRIAIPSYRRADTLATKTLAMLHAGGADPARITVFVADNDERATYAARLPAHLYGELVVSAPGLGPSRNFINRYYPEETFLLCIDDDVQRVYRKSGPNDRTDVDDLHALFTEMFYTLTQAQLTLVGIYPVDNPYFMRAGYTTDLRYIIGALYGQLNMHRPWYRVSLEDKEDYERTVLHYINAGGVLRCNGVGMVTRYYQEPGGMQETRTAERVTLSAVTLARRYPQLIRLNTKKASGHTEVAFRRLAKGVR